MSPLEQGLLILSLTSSFSWRHPRAAPVSPQMSMCHTHISTLLCEASASLCSSVQHLFWFITKAVLFPLFRQIQQTKESFFLPIPELPSGLEHVCEEYGRMRIHQLQHEHRNLPVHQSTTYESILALIINQGLLGCNCFDWSDSTFSDSFIEVFFVALGVKGIQHGALKIKD